MIETDGEYPATQSTSKFKNAKYQLQGILW